MSRLQIHIALRVNSTHISKGGRIANVRSVSKKTEEKRETQAPQINSNEFQLDCR